MSLDTCIIGHFGVESFQEITYTGTNLFYVFLCLFILDRMSVFVLFCVFGFCWLVPV